MSLPYGFMLAPDGRIAIDQEKANTVRAIYQQYLSGMSLKGIADFLFVQGLPSPKGKAQWTQAVINGLLSNQRYIGSIVSFDEFFMAQGEKDKIDTLKEQVTETEITAKEIRESHQRLLSWANMFDTVSIEEKKMVASYLIKAVTLTRDYGIQIEFNVSEAQYLGGMEMG